MNHSYIIDGVNKSIGQLCSVFKSTPSLFFTEYDINCYFYSLLRANLPDGSYKDRDGLEHSLIHTEYPTPFRCDMRGAKFERVDDEKRTPKGGKYRRGHYDLVILNPNFIRQHSFEVIKAQNYELYKEVIDKLKAGSYDPVILYGIEFMYSRDPLKFSRGDSKEKSIDQFVDKVNQDYGKLQESLKYHGFMKEARMLVFVKGSSQEMGRAIESKLHNHSSVVACFA